MIKLASDENFDGDILRGLVRRLPGLDVVRVQDAGLAETPDPYWPGRRGNNGFSLPMTTTMPNFACDRVRAGTSMPGVFLVSNLIPKGQAIDQLFLALQCLSPDDCKDQVTYFPF